MNSVTNSSKVTSYLVHIQGAPDALELVIGHVGIDFNSLNAIVVSKGLDVTLVQEGRQAAIAESTYKLLPTGHWIYNSYLKEN